jgi:hypothetical protein
VWFQHKVSLKVMFGEPVEVKREEHSKRQAKPGISRGRRANVQG